LLSPAALLSPKCTKYRLAAAGSTRIRWGSLQRSPRPLSWIKRGLLLRGGEGREKEGRGRGKRGRKGKRRGREGRWKKGEEKGGGGAYEP